MPTYEYVCSNCDNHWEEVQRISEPPVQNCPKCAQATAKRQISGGSFILKGGGWYADLYSSSKPAKKEDGGGGGEAKAKDAVAGEAKGKEASAPVAKTEATTSKPSSTSSAGGSSGGGRVFPDGRRGKFLVEPAVRALCPASARASAADL
jgi:putative FmdB family regulatory protein